MQNAHGFFVLTVYILSGHYETFGSRWMYTVEDWEHKSIDGEIPEMKLK